jgi:signal transduction histidine kinase
MSLFGWCQWLEHTPLALAIAESDWLFPLIEGSHILALPLSVGMIVIFDLRLLGLAFLEGPASTIMTEMLRWSKAGFAVMFITGVLLFMTHAGKAYGNVFFRAKLMFLLLLGINALVYQTIFYPKMTEWDVAHKTPVGARLCAGLSLIVWIGVIICGRTMAYQF